MAVTLSALDIAIQRAEAFIPDDCGLLETATQELPEGWYFIYQSKKYLDGDDSAMLIGSGGFIVERDAGQIVEFGSPYQLDVNLKAYRAGLLNGAVDLTLVKFRDPRATAAALGNIGIFYMTPEYESGEVWRIGKRYSIRQIESLFRSQTVFAGLHLGAGSLEALETLKKCCEFSLAPAASGLDRLRCTGCESTAVIPNASTEDRRIIASLHSSDALAGIRAIEDRLGLGLEEAKGLASHLTLTAGVCHQCGEKLPTDKPVQCTACPALNVDWLP